mgnify:CR=1 FL=1
MSDNRFLIGGVIFLGILVLIATVLVIIQLAKGHGSGSGSGGSGGNHGHHDNTTLDPLPPSYDCKQTTASTDAVLYLMPEANGFDVTDLDQSQNLIHPDVAQELFPGGVAVVANYSDPNGVDAQYNHAKVKALGLPVIKWVVFYFGKDGPYCRCQNGADKNGMIECSDVGVPCNTCKAKGDSVKWQPGPCNLCKYNDANKPCFPSESGGSVVEDLLAACNNIQDLRGIMYDDETGDPKNTVVALELVKEKWDNAHPKEPPLMLGSTGTISSSENSRPRNEAGQCTWDIVLGQAYTDTTADYYSGSCTPSDGWWKQVREALGTSPYTRGVPLVCGAGDCVGDVSAATNVVQCYDERLNGNTITALLKDRPPDFPWKNFGIWYGTTAAPCGFQNCYASDAVCKTGCCKNGWKLNKEAHSANC